MFRPQPFIDLMFALFLIVGLSQIAAADDWDYAQARAQIASQDVSSDAKLKILEQFAIRVAPYLLPPTNQPKTTVDPIPKDVVFGDGFLLFYKEASVWYWTAFQDREENVFNRTAALPEGGVTAGTFGGIGRRAFAAPEPKVDTDALRDADADTLIAALHFDEMSGKRAAERLVAKKAEEHQAEIAEFEAQGIDPVYHRMHAETLYQTRHMPVNTPSIAGHLNAILTAMEKTVIAGDSTDPNWDYLFDQERVNHLQTFLKRWIQFISQNDGTKGHASELILVTRTRQIMERLDLVLQLRDEALRAGDGIQTVTDAEMHAKIDAFYDRALATVEAGGFRELVATLYYFTPEEVAETGSIEKAREAFLKKVDRAPKEKVDDYTRHLIKMLKTMKMNRAHRRIHSDGTIHCYTYILDGPDGGEDEWFEAVFVFEDRLKTKAISGVRVDWISNFGARELGLPDMRK